MLNLQGWFETEEACVLCLFVYFFLIAHCLAHWQLAREEWKDDVIPEFMDGKNIADFVDPDILQRLEELEAEEEQREAAGEYDVTPEDPAVLATRALADR